MHWTYGATASSRRFAADKASRDCMLRPSSRTARGSYGLVLIMDCGYMTKAHFAPFAIPMAVLLESFSRLRRTLVTMSGCAPGAISTVFTIRNCKRRRHLRRSRLHTRSLQIRRAEYFLVLSMGTWSNMRMGRLERIPRRSQKTPGKFGTSLSRQTDQCGEQHSMRRFAGKKAN